MLKFSDDAKMRGTFLQMVAGWQRQFVKCGW